MRRSLLFVPGAEPRKIERARDSVADTLLFDLEDAVAPQRKDEARANVAAALRAGGFGSAEVAVRVNAPGTPFFEADLEAVVSAGGRTILLPKSESVAEVQRVARRLDQLEGERKPGEETKLLLLVESPAGVANALAVGGASPRVTAVCFGHADFSLSMGLSDADATQGVVYHARCTLVIAARACGVSPIDTVVLAVKDEAAFRADAELGLRLGFDGKLCIHPSQAEIANEVYTPKPEQVAHAHRVVEAWEQAQKEGVGVFSLDGKMIDAPVVAAQHRVLERAKRATC